MNPPPFISRGTLVTAAFFALLATTAGADPGRWIAPTKDARIEAAALRTLLDGNRLAASENIKAMPLYRDRDTSVVLVQVRDREPPHYHADSAITVVMLEGRGELHLGGEMLNMVAGDAALVPRGMPHHFVNRGEGPAAALVIYAPPPGENDRVLIK